MEQQFCATLIEFHEFGPREPSSCDGSRCSKRTSVLTQKFGDIHSESVREVEEAFVEQPTFAVLYINKNVTGNSRGQRQLFLGHPPLDSHAPHLPAHTLPRTGPSRCTFRISLVWACGHAPQLWLGNTKSLPY